MKLEGNIKQEHILEAAIKRFSYFGVSKTTLTEIADDLAISKPLLFYYFQDKNSLIDAVVEKILNEFLEEFEGAVEHASVEQGLVNVVEIKRAYFKKYFLLAIQGDATEMNKISSSLPPIYKKGKERMQQLLAALLKKGKEQDAIAPIDEQRVSELLLETLSAFEFSMKARKAIPDVKDIEEMFDKQLALVHMILNGLKKQ